VIPKQPKIQRMNPQMHRMWVRFGDIAQYHRRYTKETPFVLAFSFFLDNNKNKTKQNPKK